MSLAVRSLRVVVGLVFVVFGLNGFFNFIAVPELAVATAALLWAYRDAFAPLLRPRRRPARVGE